MTSLRARLAAWQRLLPAVREICLARNTSPVEIARLAQLAPADQRVAVGIDPALARQP